MLKQLTWMIVASVSLAACSTTQNFVAKINSPETPLQWLFKAQPELKSQLHNIEIRQVFNRVEAPTVAQVVVLQTGLADDSIAAVRSTYRFKLNAQQWQQVDQLKEYKCVRGKNITAFQKQLCH